MHWLFLAAISVLSISVASLFQKIAMREDSSDPVSSSIIFQFLLSFFTLLFALTRGLVFPQVHLLPYFLGSAALYAFGTIKFFQAIKILEASQMSIIASSGVLVTVIASVLFLRDTITFTQILGISLVLSAILLLNLDIKKITFGKGEFLAFLGTSSYGLAVVIDTFIIRSFDPVSFIPFASFMPGILMVLFYIKKMPQLVSGIRNVNKNLILYTLLYAVQAITFYLALAQGALVAQMSSLSKTTTIFTVILSVIFLNERSQLGKKFIAAVLTTVGVFLIT